MAAEGFTVAHQQPIGAGQSLPIAEAEGTPAGAEGEQAGHGMADPVPILQLPAQQQQAAGTDPPSTQRAKQLHLTAPQAQGSAFVAQGSGQQ
jgi:hypothetical protein